MGLMFVRDVLTNHRCRFNLYTVGGRTRFEIYFAGDPRINSKTL
jgi:hypothetical protein